MSWGSKTIKPPPSPSGLLKLALSNVFSLLRVHSDAVAASSRNEILQPEKNHFKSNKRKSPWSQLTEKTIPARFFCGSKKRIRKIGKMSERCHATLSLTTLSVMSSIATLSIETLSITKLYIKTLTIMTLSLTTLSVMSSIATLSIETLSITKLYIKTLTIMTLSQIILSILSLIITFSIKRH